MGRTRWVAGIVAFVALAACAGDAGTDVELTRPPTVSTTGDAGEAPAATDTAVPADGIDPGAPEVDDPMLVGASTSRAGGGRSAGASNHATGRIEIPAIGLSHPTFEGVALATINHGPSHWPGTPLPGEPGNTVFPGHRTTYSRPFWDIDELVPGDEVIFTTPAGRFTYRVTETLIVGEYERWILRSTAEPTFTIFACHPKGSARQRFVVKGELVSAPATTTTVPPSSTTTTTTTTTTRPPSENHSQGILPGLPG